MVPKKADVRAFQSRYTLAEGEQVSHAGACLDDRDVRGEAGTVWLFAR